MAKPGDDWTEADWRDLHEAIEGVKRKMQRRRVLRGDPPTPAPTADLPAAALAAYEVLNDEYGNGVRNGYFPAIAPVLTNLRAALGLPAIPPFPRTS